MNKDFLLVWKMKNGDEEAMDCFVRKYYPVILRYCQYHLSDRVHSEDLVQETFERFFKALAGYEHNGKAINYLYVIARNLCSDFNRKRTEFAVAEIPEPEENQLRDIEERLDVARALEYLSDEMREVIILHYFQDLSLKEISKILDIGLPLVKYRIRKAKERLRVLLGKEETP